MIRYITSVYKDSSKEGKITHEKHDGEKRSVLLYFKNNSVARNFYRELNNIQISEQGECLHFLKVDSVVIFDNFKKIKSLLLNFYQIPTCVLCLSKLDNNASNLTMRSFLKS